VITRLLKRYRPTEKMATPHTTIYARFCHRYGFSTDNVIILTACPATVRGITSITGCTQFGRSVIGMNVPQKKIMGMITRNVKTTCWYRLSSHIAVTIARDEKNVAVTMMKSMINGIQPNDISTM